MAVLALMFGIIQAFTGVVSVWPSIAPWIGRTPTPTPPFSPAPEGEALIVVTQLEDRSAGVHTGIDATQRIYDALIEIAADLPHPPRVEWLHEPMADSRSARARMKDLSATALIWGWVDALGTQCIVEVNTARLNLAMRSREGAAEQAYHTFKSAEMDLTAPESVSHVFRQLLPAQASYLAFLSLGLAQIHAAEWDEAITCLAAAIENAPAEAGTKLHLKEAHILRGLAHALKGELDAAIPDYNRAIEIDPQFKEAYVNRGVAHALKGELDAAIADFERYLQLAPDAEDRVEVERWLKELRGR